MNVLTPDEFHVNFDDHRMNIQEGAIFIHPTDTIYGLGCDARNKDAVKKIRDIKNKHESPFSIIAPSKTWVLENCEVNDKVNEWLSKLPGPYTLVLRLKNKDAVSPNVNFDLDTIGVRMPDHWFSKQVERLGVPIVSTTVSKPGCEFMTSLENLDSSLHNDVDFIIYEKEKQGKPSLLIDLSNEHEILVQR